MRECGGEKVSGYLGCLFGEDTGNLHEFIGGGPSMEEEESEDAGGRGWRGKGGFGVRDGPGGLGIPGLPLQGGKAGAV